MQRNQPCDTEPSSFWRSRYGVGLVVLGSVAGYFLWTEHRAHLAGALPYILLLSCLVMHLFMHHGHGHDSHPDQGGEGQGGTDAETGKGRSHDA